MLQEGLGAGVGGKERCRCESTEGAHGEDEATLLRKHIWEHSLSDPQSAEAVDVDDILHLVLWRLSERNRYAMRLADIVDEYRDLFSPQKLGESCIVGV